MIGVYVMRHHNLILSQIAIITGGRILTELVTSAAYTWAVGIPAKQNLTFMQWLLEINPLM